MSRLESRGGQTRTFVTSTLNLGGSAHGERDKKCKKRVAEPATPVRGTRPIYTGLRVTWITVLSRMLRKPSSQAIAAGCRLLPALFCSARGATGVSVLQDN